MKINRYLIIAIAAITIIAQACSSKKEEKQPETVEASKVLVEVSQTKTTKLLNQIEFTGVVQAWEEAYIGAATPARIEKIFVDIGDKVSKGQLIVQMDRTILYQANVQLDNLKNELNRIETLLKEGAVTQQSYDQIKTQYDVAVSNIKNLAINTEIRSTLDGIVTGRYYSDGEIFSMSPSPAGKPAIVAVKQIQPVKILVGVSERYFNNVKIGQTASVTSEIFSDKTFEGKVAKIHPTIDRASGTFNVELRLENRGSELLPGMFTRVALNLGEIEGLIIPARAVMKQVGSNERFVFVVEDGKAIRKTVQLGRKIDDNFEILSGLKTGEKLVVVGQSNLMHLSEVHIVN
ncbi:MAG: efflux RND transporter periplasmic adaptor subunit [Bacteroidetes bacterium]|nr:efflux RND transporter periplasmic adaptor subunit [Bacteroidota bacterium]